MSLQSVLVVGPPEDALNALVQSLAEESIIDCWQREQLAEALNFMALELPDLVVVFADPLEEAGEDVNAFCVTLREQTSEYRPVLVVQTGSTDPEQRIAYLINGADDTLSTDLQAEEVRIRLLVHLRRNLDLLSHRVTRLPGLQLTTKILQRRMNRSTSWGLLLVELDRFAEYTEVYGQIAAQQVLKTFAAMLGAIVVPPDFIGHTDTQAFAVITHADHAEDLAALLCRQFDAVVRNFYSERDQRLGYIVSLVDERASRRVGFLCLRVGVVTRQSQAMDQYQAAFTLAGEMKALARSEGGGSVWVSDRLRLTGQAQAAAAEPKTRQILVVESDAAMAYLLKATLEMQGFTVETVSSAVEAQELLADAPRGADLVMMDSLLSGQEVGWELCRQIKAETPRTKVIFLSTVHNREKAFSSGADLYLPKPFELGALFNWVERLFL